MYKYKVIYQNKADDSYFTPTIIGFNKRDLNIQIMRKCPDGYRYIRTVTEIPGTLSKLNPIILDMIINPDKTEN